MHLKPTADNTIMLKSPREIAIMREAGKVVAADDYARSRKATEPGMTTRDLDQIAATMFKEAGAESTALGYFGYPGHICVSVNDEVVHGIPGRASSSAATWSSATSRRGIAGTSPTRTHCFAVGGHGTLAPRTRELVQVTQEALFHGIEQAVAGNRLSDIGAAIEAHVKQARHVGRARFRRARRRPRQMHEAPQVQHHGPPGGAGAAAGHVSGDRAAGQSRIAGSADAGRRLDGGHRGRQLELPLRAHRGDHADGPQC